MNRRLRGIVPRLPLPGEREQLPQEQVHARGDPDDEHEDVGQDHQPAGPRVELDVPMTAIRPYGYS